MRTKITPQLLVVFVLGALALGALLYQLPPVQDRLGRRVDIALTYLRGMLNPADRMPAPQAQAATPQPSPTPSPTASPTATLPPLTPTPLPPTPTLTPTPIPSAVALARPAYEKQDWNACGPATLTMYLRSYGWAKDQTAVSEVIKPDRDDRNVNVEELVYFVRNYTGWLNIEFRVGGDIETLKKLLAAGLPVMIEGGTPLDQSYWPSDDHWAGHYLLLTGYDDVAGEMDIIDSYHQNITRVSYEALKRDWQAFNYVYIMVYPPDREADVRSILGPHWDADYNRQSALDLALAETESDNQDAFAWFNVGSNYVYFERYSDAALAYDTARNLGLPQRMLRYQFGPFFAYFHSGRSADLKALTAYALQRTPNSEEALLWNGWSLYRDGNSLKAIEQFRAALKVNPGYQDARYALDFLGATP